MGVPNTMKSKKILGYNYYDKVGQPHSYDNAYKATLVKHAVMQY